MLMMVQQIIHPMTESS